ncbi:MAG: DUF362 domain-containing protein [Phycisphaerae bacterium]
MVRQETVKNRESNRCQPSRRELLGAAAAAALGLFPGANNAFGQATQPAGSAPATDRPAYPPWWLRRYRGRSRVIDIRSNRVLHASVADRFGLGEMLDQGVQDLTWTRTAEDAWRSVLGSAKRIVLKFNSVGARAVNTNNALAKVLVERIAAAGYEPQKIALAEVPAYLMKELGTRPVVRGWGAPIEVGGGLEPLAQYLYDADAIINVPLLKTHQIAGMSGCMKNLSHALLRHPARYHANGCSPYVGQVIGSQEVSSRLKLNIVNALRVVVNRGPEAQEEDIVAYGGLLLGFDPLAVDNVGLSILTAERRRRGLPASFEVRYLASAAKMRLGRWRPADVDRAAVEMDG